MLIWVIMAIWQRSTGAKSLWQSKSWGFNILLVVVMSLVVRTVGQRSFTQNLARPANGWLGLTLVLVGAALAVWARLELGKSWGAPMTKSLDSELVATGPYRWIHHPIYVGLVLMLVGTSVAYSYWLLVPTALVAGFFATAAKQEERHMLKRFGDRYKS
jgi:protein-S-isoprenylcysteine O-methyltransferase Ste14